MPDDARSRKAPSSDGSSHYDEFAMLADNAAEFGLPFDADHPPAVRRERVVGASGNELSALVWGTEPAELILLHGGAQNAHTWDTVALALDRPLVAIDLPGHGHSDWRPDHEYAPQKMVDDISVVIDALAPDATTLVGMSLGGLTAIATLAKRPDVADRIVVIDVTPGVDQVKAEPIISFISGPETFESFDAILERTMAFNPTRSRSSLRRGVLHNARPLDDGTWAWRYDLPTGDRTDGIDVRFGSLWEAVEAIAQPVLFVQGELSAVVDEDDLAELQRRCPQVEIVEVEQAGHSVQGDRPLELAELLTDFMDGPRPPTP